MKKIYTFAALILIIAMFLVWLAWPRKSIERQIEKPMSNTGRETTQNQEAASEANQSSLEKPQTKQSNRVANLDPSIPAEVWEHYQRIKADPNYDWKQPIEFYGKVIDENGVSVADATAHFTWNDLSENGTSETNRVSDSNGLFSIAGETGKRLSVLVTKEGYYTPRGDLLSFEYANPADGLFTPDVSKPVVFHLRKKGAGTDLITSQYGVKPHLGITMPLDGTAVQVDLLERKIGGSGQMKFSQIKPPPTEWKHAKEWSFRMEVPDGGFIEHNAEFPFEAPENGYQPVVEFHFEKGNTNWAENINKKYYIKFGSPPRYGHLQVDTLIEMGGARITYAINPDGSRNLESK